MVTWVVGCRRGVVVGRGEGVGVGVVGGGVGGLTG